MEMREITGSQGNTLITVKDELGYGGAYYEYYIGKTEGAREVKDTPPVGEFGHAFFQNGPIKEKGINGCSQEDLLLIVIDRLESFQSGDFACRENAIAKTKCEEALLWLNRRTDERIKRGVEGTNVK